MKKVYKNIGFIAVSMIISTIIVALYLGFDSSIWTALLIVAIGPSVGLTSGIIFLLVNKFLLLNHKNKNRFYTIRILVYLLILGLIYLSFFVPGLFYDLEHHFELI